MRRFHVSSLEGIADISVPVCSAPLAPVVSAKKSSGATVACHAGTHLGSRRLENAWPASRLSAFTRHHYPTCRSTIAASRRRVVETCTMRRRPYASSWSRPQQMSSKSVSVWNMSTDSLAARIFNPGSGPSLPGALRWRRAAGRRRACLPTSTALANSSPGRSTSLPPVTCPVPPASKLWIERGRGNASHSASPVRSFGSISSCSPHARAAASRDEMHSKER